MLEFIEDAVSSPGFWILSVLAISATIIGWTMSKGWGASLPVWQLVVILIIEIIAAAAFGRE